jgi:DNA polymerase III, alpha subunit
MNEVINKEFNHLKIHTQYSICEGALRILDLAKYCKTHQVKAAGLCDSNNLCGALEFSELIAKSKTQPIIGSQISFQYKNHTGKIPLFAKNLEGYKNLIKLSSKSFLEVGDNEDPHCKIDDLEKNSNGLIMLSGSFDGLIGKLFFKNLLDEIHLLFKRFNKVFNDNFYVEIQRHGNEGEKLFEQFLLDASNKQKLPIIATHEVFYLEPEMHEAHDAYLCVGEKTYVNAKDRRKYTNAHYLKNSEEMCKLFNDLPEALEII